MASTRGSERGRVSGDQIVYLVVDNGGGMDGMDFKTYPGGGIKRATFDKREAEAKKDAWSHVKTQVVNVEDAKKAALKKLDPIDRLILGL